MVVEGNLPSRVWHQPDSHQPQRSLWGWCRCGPFPEVVVHVLRSARSDICRLPNTSSG